MKLKQRWCSWCHPQGMACAILTEMLRKPTWVKRPVAAMTLDLGWAIWHRQHGAGVSNRGWGERCEPRAGAEINMFLVLVLEYKRRTYNVDQNPSQYQSLLAFLTTYHSFHRLVAVYCSIHGTTYLPISDKRDCCQQKRLPNPIGII